MRARELAVLDTLVVGPDQAAARIAQLLTHAGIERANHRQAHRIQSPRDCGGADVILRYVEDATDIEPLREWRNRLETLPVILVIEHPVDIAQQMRLFEIAGDILVLSEAGPGWTSRCVLAALTAHRMQHQFRLVLAQSPDGVVVVDEQGDVRYANAAAGDLFGRAAQAMVGEPFGVPVTADAVTEIALGDERSAEMRVVEIAWQSSSTAYLATLRDITDRKQAEVALVHAAEHDGLTALVNRSRFQKDLAAAVASAAHTGTRLAVLFIDVDNFKVINDTYGHDAGDQLLRHIADRLRAVSRSGTLISRLGGDEFTVLADNVSQDAEVRIAQRFIDAFAEPLVVQRREFRISLSIGVATYPESGSTAQGLITAADSAMYAAKQDGRNCFRFHSHAAHVALARRNRLENDLRHALVNKEFFQVFQPIMSADGRRIEGLETLLRWQHPEYGNVPPGEFIELAETGGWIDAIGRWVLVEACRQLSRWRSELAADISGLYLSINVSTQQLKDEQFAEYVARVLNETGLPADRLWLEMTETSLMQNLEDCRLTLTKLRAAGCRIAIDDFGTGYSSLNYLQRLPVDILKIDRSFVSELIEQSTAPPILRSVMDMAVSLGLTVVAEGVETPTQIQQLRAVGCHLLQGFYFSRPLTVVNTASYLCEHPVAARMPDQGIA